MPAEFDLIRRHFSRPAPGAALGVGDDAALLELSSGHQLVVSTDTLVSGVHFFADVQPAALGWKAAAVNLSDLAAMGARPRWLTLALTLPQADDNWLAGFARGFYDCAGAAGAELVGGDTTQGPLSITVTAMGEIGPGRALRRNAARPGQDIWVSGELGDAALGLAALRGEILPDLADQAVLLSRLTMPQPRNALGIALTAGLASACIDISDGLLADLGHILAASATGAVLRWPDIPLSVAARHFSQLDGFTARVLAGGDDYELCFTADVARRADLDKLADRLGVPLTRIGEITALPGLQLLDDTGCEMSLPQTGYAHFSA